METPNEKSGVEPESIEEQPDSGVEEELELEDDDEDAEEYECSNCGTTVDADDVVCPSCGATL